VKEGTALICAPSKGNPAEQQIAGTMRYRCAECGQAVWVAPSGQEKLKQPDVFLLCIPCGLAMIKSDPDPEIAPPTLAQQVELDQHRRRN
jgi:DNA-directed RNA polymerase subunit RPC12/RpoP